MSIESSIASMTGAEALPRRNGELVFEAPWEARAFGVAVGLVQQQGLDWDEFRRRLIDEIGTWEREDSPESHASWSYYERWLKSLEHLLLDAGMLTEDEIDARTREIAHQLDHEHDHHHEHDRERGTTTNTAPPRTRHHHEHGTTTNTAPPRTRHHHEHGTTTNMDVHDNAS
jgi:nitrile hydratase accessory protein